MKTAGRLVAVACALVVWTAISADDEGGRKPNLIYNGGFERLNDGAPDGWFGREMGVSPEAAYDGQYGLVLRPGASAAALGVASVPTLKYDISGWVRSGGQARCGIRGDFFAPDGRLVESIPVALDDDACDGWHFSQQRVEVPIGAGCLVLTVYNDGDTNVFVDDLACYEVYQARLQKTSSPPSIDGILDDACWEDASVGDEPWITTRGTVAKQQTTVFACYDDDHLYVAFRLFTRDPDRLKTEEARDDFYVWRDDSAEVFIDPNHDHATYCELEVNANNVEYDAWALDKDWECIWEHAVGRESGAWTCEMAIDLASFEYRDSRGRPTGRMMLPRPDVWGINFSRNDYITSESSSWPNTGDDFHNAPAYGHLLGFFPLRGAAYSAEADHRIRLLRVALAGWGLALRGPEALADESAVDHESNGAGPLRLLAGLSAELDGVEDCVTAASEYDDWLHIGRQLDELGAGFAVLGELVQPALARDSWGKRIGQPVAIGLSLSPEPVLEDGPPAVWRLDDGLCVAMGKGDVSGFGIGLDAYADTRGVRVSVDVPGLCEETAAVVSAPNLDEHESEQWPRTGLDLPAGSRALLWAPLHSEDTASAGVYPGTVTVSAEGHPTLVQGFSVQVLDISVPRSGALGLSVLQPAFAARDITSELAGFGVIDGSAAVGSVPAPADGRRYEADEVARIASELRTQWDRSAAARPEMRRYVLGLVDTATVEPQALSRLYKALHRAVRGMRIMQIVTEPTAEAMRPLGRWVDIWAAPGDGWAGLRKLVDDDDECWLYYELPGGVFARGLGDARVQPWLARYLGADGIVWGTSPEPGGTGEGIENMSLPVFEMCCRMVAIGHRDCDYFYHLQETLIREKLRAKAGHHWRLTAEARMAARLYPTAIVSPEWYTTDYMSLLAQRERCQSVVWRAQRHLLPLETE